MTASLPEGWPERHPGSLDDPVDGARLEGRFALVRGWAPPVDGLLARIEVSIDGRPVGRARLGLPRPDVAAVVAHPHAPVSGFELRLDTTQLPPGPAEVSATAVGLYGSSIPLGTARVTVEEPPPIAPPDVPRAAVARRRSRSEGELRILAVAHELRPGGAPKSLLQLLRGLSAGRVRGRVLSLGASPRRSEMEAVGFPVEELPRPPFHDPEAYGQGVAAIARHMDPRAYDLALVNSLVSAAGADAALSRGLPVVWLIHEGEGTTHLELHAEPFGVHPEVHLRVAGALEAAGAVVFAAEAARRSYVEVPDGVARVIPYGISPRRALSARRARRRLGLPMRHTVLLCLASLEPRKGQTVLIEAFARVLDRHPYTTLVLVGGGDRGPYDEGLGELLRRASLRDHVVVVPWTPDPGDWLDAADVLVSASDIETVPLALLEAMAAGVPVVTTAAFGVPDVVKDGSTGFLAEPRDGASLAGALTRALDAPRRRRRMASAGRRLVRRRHDPGLAEARYLDVLVRVAGFPTPGGSPDRMWSGNHPVSSS